ncbi:unnamed protein product [Gordionus sp. m RMFG-2023]
MQKKKSLINDLNAKNNEHRKGMDIKYQEYTIEKIKLNKELEELKNNNLNVVSEYKKNIETMEDRIKHLLEKQKESVNLKAKESVNLNTKNTEHLHTYKFRQNELVSSVCAFCGVPYNIGLETISSRQNEFLSSACSFCGVPYNSGFGTNNFLVNPISSLNNEEFLNIINVLKYYKNLYGNSNFKLWLQSQISERDRNYLYDKFYFYIQTFENERDCLIDIIKNLKV